MKGRLAVAAINLILLLQALGVYQLSSRRETSPPLPPLRDMPNEIGGWRSSEDIEMDLESLRVLKPDDYLLRNYRSAQGHTANLYVAYFRSQTTDRAPHSPQNCLPGQGWVPGARGVLSIPSLGGKNLDVNRFIVARGDDKSVVLYWYETPTRPVWSEFMGRFQLMVDSLRLSRSDTALVRVVLPIETGDDDLASKTAAEFARQAWPLIRRQVGMSSPNEI